MRDLLSTILNWKKEDKSFAIARVVSTWRSAPRHPGASMLVSEGLDVVGSVSGGCIEGSVIEAAAEVLRNGGSRLLDFGVDDETAWSVGLSCGGQVQVLVEPWTHLENELADESLIGLLKSNEPFVLATTLTNEPNQHILVREREGHSGLEKDVLQGALKALSRRESVVVESGNARTFFHVFPSKARLLLVGGADITVKLLNLASSLEFETVVIDPRAVFADVARFETQPDHLINKWPQEVMDDLELDENTFAVLLTHDPKIDDPAIHSLLKSPVAYIGALGGSRTQDKRKERLRNAGFSEAQLERIHGPVGLDIGAMSPSEIALSVIAEIVAVKNQRD
ncbi:MAG: XdhC family protein [Bacteroidetes bacterium]|nr:XdhC family protein [Bacteroidota bacterium]